jgi:CRISPR/Cas system-associated exonuclease Cas4 (RecB family)
MSDHDLVLIQPQSDASDAIPPLRQSMYEAMACPASYQAQYIHGIQSPSNEYSELGQEVHRCMSIYAEHLKTNDVEEDWTFFERTLSTFSDAAQKILRGFIGSMKFNPQTILTTEERFDEYEDAAGIPDLITMETPVDATIWDYKNYFEMIDADTFQSKLYPLLLFRHNPNLETVRFVLVFMRYGRVRDVTWTRDHVPYLEKVLSDARARQRAIHETEGLARAIPGKQCEYCPLLRTARCQVNQWNPYAIMTEEDRLRYVIFLRAALYTSKQIIRDAARFRAIQATDDNGKVYEASFQPTEKRTIPLLPAISILEDHLHATGEDLSQKACISKTSLASLRKAKKRVLLDQALHDIEVVKETTTFKISKSNPDAQDDEYEGAEE